MEGFLGEGEKTDKLHPEKLSPSYDKTASIELPELSIKLIELVSPFEGEGEIHTNFHDIYIVVEGEATVLTGENLIGSKEIEPGEYRGGDITSAVEYSIKKGDVFVIPAGLAHKVIVKEGKLVQWVIKCRTESS
ncbi:MAG TPA: hypothetical protein ENG66_03555 [Thermococcus sp.]|nr:MAG: hypothetical protein DRP25_00380 [Thermotoga sp.]HDH44453.1 hypothetical protein [Thermococcus sp.]